MSLFLIGENYLPNIYVTIHPQISRRIFAWGRSESKFSLASLKEQGVINVSYVHKSRRGQKTKGWKYFVRNFFLSIQNFLNKDRVLRNTFLLSWSCLKHFLRYRILNGLVTWNAPYLIRGWWIVAITIRKRNLQSNTMNLIIIKMFFSPKI